MFFFSTKCKKSSFVENLIDDLAGKGMGKVDKTFCLGVDSLLFL